MDAEGLTLLERESETFVQSGVSEMVETQHHGRADDVAGDFVMLADLLFVHRLLRRAADGRQVRSRPGKAAITSEKVEK